MFNAESDGERTLKIGHHKAKLWVRVACPVFLDSCGSCKSLCTIAEVRVVECLKGRGRLIIV